MSDHKEPSFVHIGFSANKTGGWWYRHPQNRYTIQIVPANYFDPTRDERGWRIGIARPGGLGMRWGLMTFSAPEAAALHACRVVKDAALRDRIWESMQANDDDHKRRTVDALNRFIRRKKQ